MAEQVQQCAIDYQKHIEELQKQIKEYEAKGESSLTPEEREQLGELRRRVYRSKVRKRCC